MSLSLLRVPCRTQGGDRTRALEVMGPETALLPGLPVVPGGLAGLELQPVPDLEPLNGPVGGWGNAHLSR